jgi:hypothetical protein
MKQHGASRTFSAEGYRSGGKDSLINKIKSSAMSKANTVQKVKRQNLRWAKKKDNSHLLASVGAVTIRAASPGSGVRLFFDDSCDSFE